MDDHPRDIGREFKRRFEPPPERWWEPSIPEADKFIRTRIGGFRPAIELDPGLPGWVHGGSLAYRHSFGGRSPTRPHRPSAPRPEPVRWRHHRSGGSSGTQPSNVQSWVARDISRIGTSPTSRAGTRAHRPQRGMSGARVPIKSPKTFRDHALNLQSVVRAAAREHVRRQSGFGFGTRPYRAPVITRRR